MNGEKDIRYYYSILGIDIDATEEEIRTSYINLVKVWHPDRFADDPKLSEFAQVRLKEINDAYNKIMIHLRTNKTNGEKDTMAVDLRRTVRHHQSKEGLFSIGIISFVAIIIIIALITKKQSEPPPPPPPPPLPLSTIFQSTQEKPQKYSPKNIGANVSKGDKLTFTIGSTKDEVLKVQGTPTGIDRIDVLEEEHWSYDYSKVIFKNDRVVEFKNNFGNLKVLMKPKTDK